MTRLNLWIFRSYYKNFSIAYYLLHTKASPWQTLDDVTEYLEIFYHHCELQQYTQAFDTIYNDCDDFLSLRGYNNIRVELYGRLVQEWQPSNQDETWKFGASLTSLGNASHSLGEYQQALDYHQQSLKISQEIGDRSGIASSLMGLGNASYSLGEYQQAIDYYQQSLKIKQEIGDRSGIAKSLNNLGSASDSLGEYQQAIDYYQQSLKIKQEIGDRRGEANSWFNLAVTLTKLNREQDAIGAYRNARALFQAMELNEYVQMTDKKIQKIETSFGKASLLTARNWLFAAFSFIWCRVQKFWGFVRNHFNFGFRMYIYGRTDSHSNFILPEKIGIGKPSLL